MVRRNSAISGRRSSVILGVVLAFSLDSFDIDAAVLRKSESDLNEFLSVLATKLEDALPDRVTVRRRRIALLSSRTRVTEISLRTADAVYAVALSSGNIRMTRAKLVRDVAISTASVPPAPWLAEVRQQVSVMSGQAGDAGDALSSLL